MKIAFIGGSGHSYLRAAIDDPACAIESPVAVAGDGHDDAAARALFGRLKHAVWFDDYRSMLDQHQPAVVNVGAVFGFNGPIIEQALQRQIAVISDKPIAATWDQYHALASLCGSRRQHLITEFNLRATAAFGAARRAVTGGHIGTVALATAQKSYRFGKRPAWFGQRESFAGLMLWVASHAIDYVRYCSGLAYRRVVATGGNVGHGDYPQMEDHVAAMFELEGGGEALIHADYLRPGGAPTHGDDRLRIVGSRGIVEIIDGRCTLTTDQPPRDITDEVRFEPIHRELLNAAGGQTSDLFSTRQSLEMAAVLLTARDAQDAAAWKVIQATDAQS